MLLLLLQVSLFTQQVISGSIEFVSPNLQTIHEGDVVTLSWSIIKERGENLVTQKFYEDYKTHREILLRGNQSSLVQQTGSKEYAMKVKLDKNKYFVTLENLTAPKKISFELEVFFFVSSGKIGSIMTNMVKQKFTVLVKEVNKPPTPLLIHEFPTEAVPENDKKNTTTIPTHSIVKQPENKKDIFSTTLFLTICSAVAGCMLTLALVIIIYCSCKRKEDHQRKPSFQIEHNIKKQNVYAYPTDFNTLIINDRESIQNAEEEYTIPFEIENKALLRKESELSEENTQECYYMVPKSQPLTYEEIPMATNTEEYANMAAINCDYANL